MKSLIKIYVKYMASALLLMAGFVILQLVVAGIVIGGIYGRTLTSGPVSYTHLRAHETGRNLVCRLLLEKKKVRANYLYAWVADLCLEDCLL